jgi:hypothetical protein
MDSFKAALQDFEASQETLLSALARQDASRRRLLRNKTPPWRRLSSNRIPKLARHFQPLTYGMSYNEAKQMREQLCAYEANYDGMKTPFTPNETHIVIDTGASITITNCKTDFMTTIDPVQPAQLKGIASGLTIEGIGSVNYSFLADDGSVQDVTLHNVLYVPKCSVRLLCPRHLAESTDSATDGFNSLRDKGVLTCNGKPISIPYHRGTGLPILLTAPGFSNYAEFCAATGMLNNTCASPLSPLAPIRLRQNLTANQRIKLMLHERCNHKNWKLINHWIRKGVFKVDKAVANAEDPICAACQFGKAHRKAHKSDKGSITQGHSFPGAGVSADQLEAGSPGRVPTTRGLPTTKRYKYCNLWIDHFSKYIYPTFHDSKEASEMVKSKQEFQGFAARYGVQIKAIRADNGAYASQLFKASCDLDLQDLSFCAVGGHWQNGVAERYIGVLTQTARTILLHAMANWPGVVTEEFWPFALRHACTFHNASINPDSMLSPHTLFTGNAVPWRMKDFKVFGCPVFVLDKKLQDGDALAKWKSRSWVGVYVGHSLAHSGNVPVIYNPYTTHITPQFHVVFDEQFTTVNTDASKLSDDFYRNLYEKATWIHDDNYATIDDLYHFETAWQQEPPLEKNTKSRGRKRKQSSLDLGTPTQTTRPQDETNSEHAILNSDQAFLKCEHAKTGESATLNENRLIGDHATENNTNIPPASAEQIEESSKVALKPNLQEIPCSPTFQSYTAERGINAHVYTATIIPPLSTSSPTPSSSNTDEPSIPLDFLSLLSYSININDSSPCDYHATMACNNKEDILTQSQMFHAPDSEDFIQCQKDEIAGLKKFDVMDIHHISELPPRAKLISSIWSYRRKRLPNGVLLKYKSRICVNGKEQEFGRDYWETYAPVASWTTIRLLMLLSSIMNLKTRQVDYTQAFPMGGIIRSSVHASSTRLVCNI